MKKLQIGILSDSPFLCTGYATIASNIGNILSGHGHNVFYFANSYVGQNLVPPLKFEDGRELNFTVLGMGREMYFKDLLSIYTKMLKLDVLFILFDTFMQYPWLIGMDLSPAKVIYYYPSDGGSGLPLGCENILKCVDLPIAMSKFGQQQVKLMYGLDTKYIPHAIDLKNYFPLQKNERDLLRKKWGLTNKFVIGVVARNQGRKFLDRTIKTMALLAKKIPNAILLMHTDPDDAAQVFHLGALVKRYGIENRVLFTGMKYYKGFDYTKMNEVYNVMDVFLLTTSGEGFGIPTIEAMACAVPVVATDYTTTKELVEDNNAGFGIKLLGDDDNPDVHCNEIIDGTITGNWSVERGVCSIKDCVEKLVFLWKNPEKCKEFGNNGRVAVVKYYNWDLIGPEWIKEIETLGEKY